MSAGIAAAPGSWAGAHVVSIVAALVLFCAGCSRDETPPPLEIYAAASTGDLVHTIAERFTARTGRPVRCNLAASSVLARQIERGGHADVVLLANPEWMDHLASVGAIDDASRVDLLTNELVLVVPRDASGTTPAGVTDVAGRIALGDPDHVPVGRYARQALTSMGVWDDVRDRIVPALDARAALRLVELGEVNAGVVYRSDAARSTDIVIAAPIPGDAHDDIVYPIARTSDAAPGAAELLAFIRSADAAALFPAFGFGDGASATSVAPPPATAFWSAVRLSALVAAAAVALSAIPGIAIGWLLARKKFPGRALLDALVHLPLVLPPVVTGYLLLVALGPGGPVGGWLKDTLGVELAFTTAGAALAAAVMGFPLLVRSVRLGVELVDTRLEDAARTLGAGPLRVVLGVTLPLAMPGIVTGLVLAFARSLGEFGATITFAGNVEGETRTIPLALFNALQSPGGGRVAMQLAVLSVVLSLGALLLSEVLARRAARRRGTT